MSHVVDWIYVDISYMTRAVGSCGGGIVPQGPGVMVDNWICLLMGQLSHVVDMLSKLRRKLIKRLP